MKSIVKILFLCVFPISLCSQYVPIRGNYLYFSATETTNQNWLSMLDDIKNESRNIKVNFNYKAFNDYIVEIESQKEIFNEKEAQIYDSTIKIAKTKYLNRITDYNSNEVLAEWLSFVKNNKIALTHRTFNLYTNEEDTSELVYYKLIGAFKHCFEKNNRNGIILKSDLYLELMHPDIYVWNNKYGYNRPYIKYYFTHPAYQDYPLVGISYNQAIVYAKWVEDRINENASLSINKGTKVWHNWEKVEVTLPTEKEWEFAARGGNKYTVFPWEGESLRNKAKKCKGDMLANFSNGTGYLMGIAGYLNNAADITAPVYSYWPNNYGLYHMAGNISEMVLKKGIVKGGSWKDNAHKLKISEKDTAFYANNYVGFRIMIKVLKRNDKEELKPLSLDKKYFKQQLATIEEGKLYAAKYEVTNQLYREFCKANKAYLPDTNAWDKLFTYGYEWSGNYFNHSDYVNHPVVNITKESAYAFCKWLTVKYNQLEHREFKEVVFKLPTKSQWETIAKGGLRLSPYPWGGPYYRNSKGEYLSNHAPKRNLAENVYQYDTLSKEEYLSTVFNELQDEDNAPVLSPVNSYRPNDFGIYCAAGNAAEMVLDANETKGGSWISPSHKMILGETDSSADSREVYNGEASPFVGFRYIMEVIEK